MFVSRLLSVLSLTLAATFAQAHEYWISPDQYQVAPGEAIRADFRNGQHFEGIRLAFFSKSTRLFEYISDGVATPITPRPGDSPALQMTAPETDTLLAIVFESAPSIVTYNEFDKFLSFAEHKDFPDAEADHLAAGWPTDRIRETYTRHAKALIAVGDGTGSDAQRGMATEFVALTNPYVDDLSDGMRVKLFYQDEPRADAQVEVFDRAPDGTVTTTLHRTDGEGIATVPVTAGHEYLFDGVVLRKAENPQNDPKLPVWQTLWAALTFAVPE